MPFLMNCLHGLPALAAGLLLALLLPGRAAAQTVAPLRLQGAAWTLELDRRTGAILAACPRGAKPGAPPLAFMPPGSSLWRLGLRGGGSLRATDAVMGPMRAGATPGGGLRLRWEGKAAAVVIEMTPGADYADLRAQVTARANDVLTVTLPDTLHFAPDGLRRLIFPAEMGLALKPAFFAPQGETGPTALRRVGPDGLRRVAPALRVVNGGDAPVPLTVTPAGRALLGDSLASLWQGHLAVVNRPAAAPAAQVLLDSPNGPYLAAHPLGKGLLIRFAGRLRIQDAAQAVETIRRILAGLRVVSSLPGYAPAPERTRVVLAALPHGPAAGGWSEVPVATWRSGLAAAPGLPVATAETARQIMETLNDPATLAIINPYGEALPVGAAGWEATADAVRRFIEGGGVWVETGGHPFYFALAPARYHTLETSYPGGFSDFARLETASGTLSLYAVQDARDPKTILVPAFWRAEGLESGGGLARGWRVLARRGETWRSPPLRLRFGGDAREAAQAYARENGLTQPLAETVPARLLERWKRAVLVCYLGGTAANQTGGLDRLPADSIVHVTDFLHGGFDKQYPDLLPPNPAYGTPEAFRALIDRAHALGHLVMPYTNHTWWCDAPRGPTFAQVGDAPLLRGLDGRFAREDYAGNWGWSVCPWHPAVIAAAQRIVQQFTQDYPVDLLFQDQVGARSWIWLDLNPAAPTPWAYNQGFVNLARQTAPRIPLATEHGFDRLIGGEAQFCGLTWPLVPFEETPIWLATWLRPYRAQWPDEAWEFFPLAQYVAGEQALFANHLGGPFVTNREALLWTLAFVGEMTYRTSPFALESPWYRNWLLCLDRIQKAISARCMGAPLRKFRYRQGSGSAGVLEAVFGDTRLLLNLTPEPYAAEGVEIAPMGFYASAPGLEAGILTEYGGRRYSADGLWLTREYGPDREKLAVYAARPVAFALPADAPDRWRATSPGAEVTPGPQHLEVRFTPSAPAALAVPEEWTQVAPLRRREPPQFIGVLNLQPDTPDLGMWSPLRAGEWLRALADCAPVREGRLTVRAITNAAELTDALAHPGQWLGIVNPYGERIPVAAGADTRPMAAAVGAYVRQGGLWIETGGYPFFGALTPVGDRWEARTAGPGALYALGLSGCRIRAEDEIPAALEPTPTGREWLGAAWADSLRGQEVVANRAPVLEDYEACLARTARGTPFVVGHQLGGWGWLFRLAGRDTPPEAAVSTVRSLLEAAAARPLTRLPARTAPDLLRVELLRR